MCRVHIMIYFIVVTILIESTSQYFIWLYDTLSYSLKVRAKCMSIIVIHTTFNIYLSMYTYKKSFIEFRIFFFFLVSSKKCCGL